MKNIILSSLKESFISVKKHKKIVLTMFILQIVFFILFGFNWMKTMPPVMDATIESLNYLADVTPNLNEEALAQSMISKGSILGSDPLLIQRNFDTIKRFAVVFVALSFLIFLVFEGLNWILAVHIPKRKNFFISARNFGILLFSYFILLLLFVLSVPMMEILTQPLYSVGGIILFLLLIYFMVISFALVHNQNIYSLLKKTIFLGISKAYVIIPTIFLNMVIVGLSFMLFFSLVDVNIKPIELNLVLMIVSGLLFTFSFTFTKIFFVRVVHKLEN